MYLKNNIREKNIMKQRNLIGENEMIQLYLPCFRS